LLLGPIAYMNHSCMPNCRFKPESDGKTYLETIADLNTGEEITVQYSNEYFGDVLHCIACVPCAQWLELLSKIVSLVVINIIHVIMIYLLTLFILSMQLSGYIWWRKCWWELFSLFYYFHIGKLSDVYFVLIWCINFFSSSWWLIWS